MVILGGASVSYERGTHLIDMNQLMGVTRICMYVVERIREPRPDSALGFQVKVLEMCCLFARKRSIYAHKGHTSATKGEGCISSFGSEHISRKVFIKMFCKSQLPHESVNLSFIITNLRIC